MLLRDQWKDKAVVFLPPAVPYFWKSCELFGMENAFYRMVEAPEVYTALLDRMALDSEAILLHFLEKAKGQVDIVELWDDVAGQQGMLVNPAWWRKVMKPYLARDVGLIRDYGLKVLFHSCGAVRPILQELIEIGVDALLVFQVNAAGMEPRAIARDFGGKLAFYGGVDVQHLLTSGTSEQVADQVRYNIDCFKGCGGYMVANCHSHIRTIQGANLVAMCQAARDYPL